MRLSVVLLAFLIAAPVGAQSLRGADVSWLPEWEDAGATYTDAEGHADALTLLARHGVTALRVRLWHTPADGRSALPEVLSLARRGRALGLSLVLDLHYSDTWADPAHQTPPAAWQGVTGQALRDSVYAHTHRAVAALVAQSTPPAYVQLGNEISCGMLWPEGDVCAGDPEAWSRLAGLVASGHRAVRDAAPQARTVVHTDRGGDAAGVRWFFESLRAQGDAFDVVALSYYPWWHGTLRDLREAMDAAVAATGRDVLIAETAYPWTLAGGDATTNIVGPGAALLPGFAATPEGQADFLQTLVAQVEAHPRGLGVIAWEPAATARPAPGSPWENLAWFDVDGSLLPAASAFGASPVAAQPTPERGALTLGTPAPNPARGSVRVPVHTEGPARLTLLDALGRRQRSITVASGQPSATLDLRGLAPGFYVLRLTAPDGSRTSPLILR